MFRLAHKGDFESILKIQEENLIHNTNPEMGFLVYPITQADLEKYKVFVVEENNEILGYFAGTKLEDGLFANLFVDRVNKEYFYGKHVVLSPEIKGAGVIKKFEDFILTKLVEERFKVFVGEICLNPLNKRSFDFHVGVQGFEKVDEYVDENNYTWGVFIKALG